MLVSILLLFLSFHPCSIFSSSPPLLSQPSAGKSPPPYEPGPAQGFFLLNGSFPIPLLLVWGWGWGVQILGHSLGWSNVTYHSKLPGSGFVIMKEHIVPHSQLLVALLKSSNKTFAASSLKNFVHNSSQPNLFSRRHFSLVRSCRNNYRRTPQNETAGVKVNYCAEYSTANEKHGLLLAPSE